MVEFKLLRLANGQSHSNGIMNSFNMLLYVLELLAGCCVLMPYLSDCCFHSRSPVYSQDNGVAMWLLCSSQLIVEVWVKFHWEFGFENSVGVPRYDPHLNFQSYVVFVGWSAHRQMSHKCDARQCDSIHCNRTTCDSLFPRIGEGHPATAPPSPSHQAVRNTTVLPGLPRPFPSVAVRYRPAFLHFCSEGAHVLSDFKD